ncbi:interleukin-10 [Suncus etruscus]|uniref:interleukin-10 n=1 Tax=Suncus etruscus TaxID=109475 RepID=UPI00210FC2A7|nr:interleukin-10 [Suncus etruscus]
MFSSALLCCLVMMAGVEVCQTHGTQSGHNNCTNFLTNLNNMLRELHTAFGKVKEFFQTRDKVKSLLLNESLREDIRGYLGCHVLLEMIHFYLKEVMPTAEKQDPGIKQHVISLGENLEILRHNLYQCHHFLPCKNKSDAVDQVKNAFRELRDKGIYKAMSEFDIFINYIKEFINLRRPH